MKAEGGLRPTLRSLAGKWLCHSWRQGFWNGNRSGERIVSSVFGWVVLNVPVTHSRRHCRVDMETQVLELGVLV